MGKRGPKPGNYSKEASVRRLKRWFSLAEVARIAEVTGRDLPQLPFTHPLMRYGVDPKAIKSCMRFGADECAYRAPEKTSLFQHFRCVNGYESALELFDHPLFDYLTSGRDGDWRSRLSSFGIIPIHRGDMALYQFFFDKNLPVISDSIELVVNGDDFVSLDGIFVLSHLNRLAERGNRTSQAHHFESALLSAADALALSGLPNSSARDLWGWIVRRFLIGPRWPDQPSPRERLRAFVDLSIQFSPITNAREKAKCQRERTLAVYARAMANRGKILFRNEFLFRSGQPWKWLASNRSMLHEYMERIDCCHQEGNVSAMRPPRPEVPRDLWKTIRSMPISAQNRFTNAIDG